MAVSTFTYGSNDGVHLRVGWLIPGKAAFGATTEPSSGDVDVILDQVASEIHAKLAENGYPVNTSAVVLADAPRAHKFLSKLNEDGAASYLLQISPVANNPETGESPAVFWKKRYEEGLKIIASPALDKMSLSRDESLSNLLASGSYKDENGNEKKPYFKRGAFDFPGSRSLTED